MKKVLLVGAFVLGISAVSFAQGGPGGPGGRGGFGRTPEQSVEGLKTSLTGITDAQAAKLLVVYQAQTKSRDSLMTALGDDRSAIREKMAPLTAAVTAKLKTILTPEQFTAYEKQQAERAARGPGGGGPR
jgi:Spy/CpxP family protein refolding chaperone